MLLIGRDLSQAHHVPEQHIGQDFESFAQRPDQHILKGTKVYKAYVREKGYRGNLKPCDQYESVKEQFSKSDLIINLCDTYHDE